MTAQREQQAYIPSSEQHATTIITDVKPQVPQLTAQEHYATTITTDLQPKYQPVDLTISVPVPPKFAQALKNIQAMEGSKVTFDGVVTGKFTKIFIKIYILEDDTFIKHGKVIKWLFQTQYLYSFFPGKPEPSIKWFRENRELTDQADFEISYKDGRVSLTIPEVFEEDAGKFTCTAKNVAGSASSSAELVIKGRYSSYWGCLLRVQDIHLLSFHCTLWTNQCLHLQLLRDWYISLIYLRSDLRACGYKLDLSDCMHSRKTALQED